MIALEAARTALIVVDMQNDFCSPQGFFGRAGHDVAPCRSPIPAIATLLAHCRTTGVRAVFTRTVLPAGESEPARHRIRPERDRAFPREGLCQPGSAGAEIVAELAPAPGEAVVDKRRYSAFYGTELEERLRAWGIDTLLICGVTTNACVDSTVRDAYFRGFDVVVAADAVAAYEPHLHAAALENLRLLFGAVETSQSIIDGLSGAGPAGDPTPARAGRVDLYAPEQAGSSGPFSHGVAVDAGRLVFVSGQVARNRDGSVEGVGDPARQTDKLLDNMEYVLAQAGCGLDDVVSVTIYVTHIEDVVAIHRVRERRFGANRPASTLVQVERLVHPDFRVEITAVALGRRP